jgi:uncharacterized protein (TIGR00661 family)
LERRRRILVAPLDWGLGHATRCIPIISALLKRNAEVIIAGSGASAQLLKNEFPGLKHYPLPGYTPRYPTGLADSAMVWAMGQQLPHFIKTINEEHTQINHLVKNEKIDVLISDNRYGCYSPGITSVFITHQPNILMPESFKWMEPWVNYFNRRQINRFNACWIPAADAQLLGDMIPPAPMPNTRFIGSLSRFSKLPDASKYDLVVVASGPEPQRQMLADMLRPQLLELGLPAFLVAGKMDGREKISVTGNLTEANYLGSEKLNHVIQQGEIIIARPGYSTIMDLAQLGKKAIFIPTPGQTEQNHLAGRLLQQRIAFSMEQSVFNLAMAIKKANKFSGFTNFATDDTLLEQAIQSIL